MCDNMGSMETITLDKQSLDPKTLSMPALIQELNQQNKPNLILCKLMNILESKRMKKKLGWSRPWNKYGVNNFNTHILTLKDDETYIQGIYQAIKPVIQGFDTDYLSFIEELLNDPKMMAFTFYQNSVDDRDRQYEGLNISLGRKCESDRTKRDRFDIVLEDLRVDGAVDGKIDRVRIYVNPFDKFSDEDFLFWEKSDFEPQEFEILQGIYDCGIKNYDQWKTEKSREWAHWSVRYIDYFGAREWIPQNSSFQ
ncbi:MAG: hypothetical protein JKX97_06505 [Candidatus Lindowbacteria bacterium]|nr:hypothetical protein [Candidatus Lindowbacteria bacterium]